jgi:phytoene desaturase
MRALKTKLVKDQSIQKKAIVIGAGFAGLSTAGYLAKQGYSVTILEKNNHIGGRAQELKIKGFRFDMGPSWYLIPQAFDTWFTDMGEKRADYYKQEKLDPNYRVFFTPQQDEQNWFDIFTDTKKLHEVFERFEPGSSKRLDTYLHECKVKYTLAMEQFLYQNFHSVFDYANKKNIASIPKVSILSSYKSLIKKYFKHPYLQQILEYPVVFLGSNAEKTPGVYTLMNWVDLGEGVFYPQGGFANVAASMGKVLKKLGVKIVLKSEVQDILTKNSHAIGVRYSKNDSVETLNADLIVSNADYEHTDQTLLQVKDRSFSRKYWDSRLMSPSVLNFYIGVNKKLKKLKHHTFFFDTDWDKHFESVYGAKKEWPEKPLFYIHVPSKTDKTTAPKGKEALFILIPCALNLYDGAEIREKYLDQAISRIEELTGETFRDQIEFVESYSVSELKRDFHAFGGNGFGLGHTLNQTALFRPPNKSKKLDNLYFAGQYTLPGTGTPTAVISGKVVTDRIKQDQAKHEIKPN